MHIYDTEAKRRVQPYGGDSGAGRGSYVGTKGMKPLHQMGLKRILEGRDIAIVECLAGCEVEGKHFVLQRKGEIDPGSRESRCWHHAVFIVSGSEMGG